MTTIISASRRTDIPAFYMPWFMERIAAGSATYPNPFSGQTYTISLAPADVHSIVFWSKYYGPFLKYIDALTARDYSFICHYTITGAARTLEPNVPHWERAVEVFQRLSDQIGPRRVLWRFDPILITDSFTPDTYRTQFAALARALAGNTERCYFSFAAFYGKVERRIQRLNLNAIDPPLATKQALLADMVAIAAQHNITLYACCQTALLNDAIQPAHCIDGDLLRDLFPDHPLAARANPTREGCGCIASRDIGIYDTCGYGCVYCYATQNHARAQANLRAHDPAYSMLRPALPSATD